ncbi:MAG: ParB/RepB/Spo0J family partition protein [Promethearchaeota archaeon]
MIKIEVKEIKMSQINLSEYNTRKDLVAGTEDTSIEDLANSIEEKGLLNPIIVMRKDNNTFDLIAGQRRFLACQKLGWKTIPAIIRDITDDTDATIISLIENVHRADMNPIDKARAYQKIFDKYKDLKRVAKETGVSVSTIRKYLKLLNLTPSIQERISTTNGPAGIQTLAKIADTFSPEEQEEVLEKIGGFKQQIQLEMIKRSKGDLSKLDFLKEQALEGAFDVYSCRGLDDCQFIPPKLIKTIKDAIKKYKETNNENSFKEIVKKLKWE